MVNGSLMLHSAPIYMFLNFRLLTRLDIEHFLFCYFIYLSAVLKRCLVFLKVSSVVFFFSGKISDALTPEQEETVQAIVAMGYPRDRVRFLIIFLQHLSFRLFSF